MWSLWNKLLNPGNTEPVWEPIRQLFNPKRSPWKPYLFSQRQRSFWLACGEPIPVVSGGIHQDVARQPFVLRKILHEHHMAALKKRQREREWQQIRLGPLNADLSLMVKVAPIRNRTKTAMSVSGYMHLAQQGPWRQKLAGSIKVKFRGLGEPPVTNLAVALWILINQKKTAKIARSERRPKQGLQTTAIPKFCKF